MELYFSPLACSLASRICLYEAGAEATYVQVDAKTKRTRDGRDYLTIHPLGLVPVLRTERGELLSESAAILQELSDSLPAARLAPSAQPERIQLAHWLCFIGTELHKGLYTPLLDPKAPDGAKEYARSKASSRLAYVARHLVGRDHLLDAFSVADAYLFTILNWSLPTQVDLSPWPSLTSYQQRLRERPSVARAFREELTLYREEVARQAES